MTPPRSWELTYSSVGMVAENGPKLERGQRVKVIEDPGHAWSARQVIEAMGMLRRIAFDWPYQPPEVVRPEREAVRAWVEDPVNHPGPDAHVAALHEIRDSSGMPEFEVVAQRAEGQHPHITWVKLENGTELQAKTLIASIDAHNAHYFIHRGDARLLLHVRHCPECNERVLWA